MAEGVPFCVRLAPLCGVRGLFKLPAACPLPLPGENRWRARLSGIPQESASSRARLF